MKRTKHEFSTGALLILIFVGLAYSAYALTLQEVTEAGSTSNVSVTFTNNILKLESNKTGNTIFRVNNDNPLGSPAIVLKQNYNGEKSLNMVVYGKNTTFSNIGNYSKNESIRIWTIGGDLILGTFNNNNLIFTTGDIPALTIDGNTQNLITADGSLAYSGTCAGSIEVKQGIVVGCI